MTRITTLKKSFVPAALIAAFSAGAGAELVEPAAASILSPFNDAVATVEWIGSSAGYTGNLNWIDASVAESGDLVLTPTTLWDNKSAVRGQTWRVPRVFAKGERVDFEYDIIRGGIDTFSMLNPDDAAQFRVDASDPLGVIVGVEDIRLPRGDADYNDARFKVSFSHAAPAPSGAALLALAGLGAARRRR